MTLDFIPPPQPGIHFLCRECGDTCDPIAAEDRGGLCARCAFPTRVSRKVHTIGAIEQAVGHPVAEVRAVYVNGVEVLGTPEDPDPFKRAIDRAFNAWARDLASDEDPTP